MLLKNCRKKVFEKAKTAILSGKTAERACFDDELQRNYMCGALLGLPECKSIANKSKIASKRLA